jgi:DNA helicase IV
LLLLIANHLTLLNRKNIMVVVFTRTLQDFIRSGSTHYDFNAQKIMTHRRWQQQFLFDNDVRVKPPSEKFEEQRDFYTDQICSIIEKKNFEDIYEAILLDEVQDYTPDEIKIFHRLGKTVFLTGDSRQQIYAGSDSIQTAKNLVQLESKLNYHYRIGKNICLFADALAKDSSQYEPLINSSKYDENARPSTVENQKCSGTADESACIIKRLDIQMKAYPHERLAVISPTREGLEDLLEPIKKSHLADMLSVQADGEVISFSPETPIIACTIHAAKGLEFRAVHVASCELLHKFGLNRNMIYTASTRAKTSLSLYYSDSIHAYLEQALCVLEPPPKKPTLGRILGSKK